MGRRLAMAATLRIRSDGEISAVLGRRQQNRRACDRGYEGTERESLSSIGREAGLSEGGGSIFEIFEISPQWLKRKLRA